MYVPLDPIPILYLDTWSDCASYHTLEVMVKIRQLLLFILCDGLYVWILPSTLFIESFHIHYS